MICKSWSMDAVAWRRFYEIRPRYVNLRGLRRFASCMQPSYMMQARLDIDLQLDFGVLLLESTVLGCIFKSCKEQRMIAFLNRIDPTSGGSCWANAIYARAPATGKWCTSIRCPYLAEVLTGFVSFSYILYLQHRLEPSPTLNLTFMLVWQTF